MLSNYHLDYREPVARVSNPKSEDDIVFAIGTWFFQARSDAEAVAKCIDFLAHGSIECDFGEGRSRKMKRFPNGLYLSISMPIACP